MPKKTKGYQQTRFEKGIGKTTELGQKISNKDAEIELLTRQLAEKDAIVSELEGIGAKIHGLEHLWQVSVELDTKIENVDLEIYEKSTKLEMKRKQISRKNTLLEVNNDVGVGETSKADNSSHYAFKISKTAASKHKRRVTDDSLSYNMKRRMRSQNIDAAMAIHGASKKDMNPVLYGMVDALKSSFPVQKVVNSLKESKIEKMKDVHVKDWVAEYEKSEENMKRSLSIFYSNHVMGKAKYIDVRKANSNSDSKMLPPNLIPYKQLASHINSIDIGSIYEFHPSLTYNLAEDEIKHGNYRSCDEYILRLAKFYLKVNETRKDKLKQFDNFPKKSNDSLLFVLAFGGDAAPGYGTSFLVSFLNAGRRVMSSSENFLVFGGNVDETSKISSRFIQKFMLDIKFLESNVFKLEMNDKVYNVEFRLNELPNDMKMLAFLAGELTNSAHYFLTFANVCQADKKCITKSFGLTEGCGWQPYKVADRKQHAEEVRIERDRLALLDITEKTRRDKLTGFIRNLKCRQEFVPLVGDHIDCAKDEPLHCKNNTVKELFTEMFKVSYTQGSLEKIKKFCDIPEESIFWKFLTFIRQKIGKKLFNAIRKWYNENQNKRNETELSFRFTGAESRNYLRHFPEILTMLIENIQNENVLRKIIQSHEQSILLRKLISYSVRIENFDNSDLNDMKDIGKRLFHLSSIYNQKLSPSLWAMTLCAPVHAGITLEQYNLGLGCNSMEGREQKLQKILRYQEKTTFHNRWNRIFRHEFIDLVYLREQGYDQTIYHSRGRVYVPVLKDGDCIQCGLLLTDDKCKLCNSVLMDDYVNEKQSILSRYDIV